MTWLWITQNCEKGSPCTNDPFEEFRDDEAFDELCGDLPPLFGPEDDQYSYSLEPEPLYPEMMPRVIDWRKVYMDMCQLYVEIYNSK